MFRLNKISQCLLVSVAVLLAPANSVAEDTEIYFTRPEGGGGDANIVMMLDTSGSMDTNDCVEWETIWDDANNDGVQQDDELSEGNCSRRGKRLDELKTALYRVVDSLSSNAHIGVGVYNQNDGGRLLYPVRGLDEIDFDGETGGYLLRDAADAYQALGGPVIHDTNTIQFPSGGTEDGVVGFVFEDLEIPRHAAVSRAVIRVTPSQSSDSSTVHYRYWYEDVASPQPFDSVSAPDLQNRARSSYWTGAFSNTWYWDWWGRYSYEIDVTEAVREALTRGDWCGENALALYFTNAVDGSVDKDRYFYSRDSDRSDELVVDQWGRAPSLKVEWDATVPPPANPLDPDYESTLSCMKENRYGLGSKLDDVVDSGTDITVEESALPVGPSSYVGLRFPRIPFDANSDTNPDVIKGAKLYLQGGRNNASFSLTVKAVLGNAPEWSAPGDVKNAATAASTMTINIPRRAFDDGFVEVDVTDMVQEVLETEGWARNQALGFVVTASSDQVIAALEGGAGSAAYLTIDASAVSHAPFVPRVRDRIKEVASSINAYGNTPSMEAYSEMARYMLGQTERYAFEDVAHTTANHIGMVAGSHVYDSPVSLEECTSNNIVLLTDGSPTNDSDYAAVTDITGKSSCSGGLNREGGSYNCQVQLASWLYDSTRNGMGVPIRTHTIAFTNDAGIQENMRRVAEAGSGMFQWARNATELQSAFQDIVNSVTVENAAMAAPGVAVNQLNRFSYLDQVYYGVFRPALNTFWHGNLKRYKLGIHDGQVKILDQTGAPAVDSDTGFFKDSANSWWGVGEDPPDGPDVDLGGAVEQTRASETPRRFLIASDLPSPSGGQLSNSRQAGVDSVLADSAEDIPLGWLGLALGETEQRARLFEWLMNVWGDPLHSEPVLVNYGFSGTLEEAALDPSKQDNMLFLATNDGLLRGIDPVTGRESFAFTTRDELLKAESRYNNEALDEPKFKRTTYGYDGGVTVWRKPSGSGVDHVFLYVAQRRGGNNYYAVDVTDRNNPRLMWRINGDSSPFQRLGQTWSRPTLSQVRVNGAKIPVLVFGGGYSSADHDDSSDVSSGDSTGNAIYIVNAYTGALVWSASSSGGTVTHSDMKWSIPAAPAVVDVDFDGVMDYIYAADLGGQLFRVDMRQDASSVSDVAYRVVTLAKLGISDAGGLSNHRRFFAAPVVSLGETAEGPVLYVSIGSGARPHPISEQTQDMIFTIIDEYGYDARSDSATIGTPVTLDSLVDVSDVYDADVGTVAEGGGWYLKLDTGEKIVSSGVVIPVPDAGPDEPDAIFVVPSYLPDETSLSRCTNVLGKTRQYALGVRNGGLSPAMQGTVQEGRAQELMLPGLPPDPQWVVIDGKSAVITGTGAIEGPTPEGLGKFKRTRWFQAETEDEALGYIDEVVNGQ